MYRLFLLYHGMTCLCICDMCINIYIYTHNEYVYIYIYAVTPQGPNRFDIYIDDLISFKHSDQSHIMGMLPCIKAL